MNWNIVSKVSPTMGQFEWVFNAFSNCKCAANFGENILFSWVKIGIEYC